MGAGSKLDIFHPSRGTATLRPAQWLTIRSLFGLRNHLHKHVPEGPESLQFRVFCVSRGDRNPPSTCGKQGLRARLSAMLSNRGPHG